MSLKMAEWQPVWLSVTMYWIRTVRTTLWRHLTNVSEHRVFINIARLLAWAEVCVLMSRSNRYSNATVHVNGLAVNHTVSDLTEMTMEQFQQQRLVHRLSWYHWQTDRQTDHYRHYCISLVSIACNISYNYVDILAVYAPSLKPRDSEWTIKACSCSQPRLASTLVHRHHYPLPGPAAAAQRQQQHCRLH